MNKWVAEGVAFDVEDFTSHLRQLERVLLSDSRCCQQPRQHLDTDFLQCQILYAQNHRRAQKALIPIYYICSVSVFRSTELKF